MESLVHGMLSNAAAVAVLAVLVAIAGRVCRRPALIHSVCLLAMLKLVTPPVVPLPVPVPAAVPWSAPAPAPAPAPVLADEPALDVADVEPAEEPPIAEDFDAALLPEPPPEDIAEAPAPPTVREWSWEAVALGVVLAGALAWWALAAVRIVRFHRLIRDVEPMSTEWQAEIAELAGRLGLRRPPTACLVPGDVPPMLWAVGPRARLLVPSRLWATLGDDERTSLLLHELAHLKRRDHWVRWGELAVAGLYWWHPAVWWLRRALREAEEQCCDAWVVWAMPRGARTYAAALVAALEFVSGHRTVPAAAASATLGNGHVSCLKRRLRMIVRAKTPKRLSWAGRLAVAGLSALLLPLAPSWGQKDDGDVKKAEAPLAPGRTVAEAHYARAADELFELDIKLIDAQAALEATQAQLDQTRQNADEELEARIREEFSRDPDVRPLIEQIKETKETLEKAKAQARHTSDPSVVASRKQLRKLEQQWNDLWDQKHDEIARRLGAEDQGPEALVAKAKELQSTLDQLKRKRVKLAAMIEGLETESTSRDTTEPSRTLARQDAKPKQAKDDDKDARPKEARSREVTERIEKELRELKEKLGKDLDPVGDEVRKSLERSLDEIQQTLKKEGMTAEDLRRAMEKSRNELRESLKHGGAVEKQMREAADRARKDMQEAMERSLKEADHAREDVAARMKEVREQQKKRAAEMAEQHRKVAEEHRKVAEERREAMRKQAERMRDLARAKVEERKATRPRTERPKAEEKGELGVREKAERPEAGREDLDSARKEIRELEVRLREANRRLEQLQRRESRRPARAARAARPNRRPGPSHRRPRTGGPAREPAAPAPAARPATPAPARPAEPRRPARAAEPRRPTPPARPAEPERTRERDDYDRRFRDLDDKMDRLLKELQELKSRPSSGARAAMSRLAGSLL